MESLNALLLSQKTGGKRFIDYTILIGVCLYIAQANIYSFCARFDNASLIAYGALLNGAGQIWFDNITFEIVDDNVPTTGSVNGKKSVTQDEPANLDFEK